MKKIILVACSFLLFNTAAYADDAVNAAPQKWEDARVIAPQSPTFAIRQPAIVMPPQPQAPVQAQPAVDSWDVMQYNFGM